MNMEESNNGSKKLQIRNSTAEFLIFQIENKEEGIEVLYQDETLWLTQKTMSILFDVDIRTINEHLKNIYSQGEVDKNTTIRKNRIVQKEGNRNISREVFIYSLDAIISVGYRVNSVRATQFRSVIPVDAYYIHRSGHKILFIIILAADKGHWTVLRIQGVRILIQAVPVFIG